MKSKFHEVLDRFACRSGLAWVGEKTLEQAWQQCGRGDWMIWFAEHVGVSQKLILSAAIECVRLSLTVVHVDDTYPRKAMEAAMAWADGNCTLEYVKRAEKAVDRFIIENRMTIQDDATVDRVSEAASYLAHACYTWWAFSSAVSYAAGALQASGVAEEEAHQVCAHIVREVISLEAVTAALEAVEIVSPIVQSQSSLCSSLEW